MRLRRGIYTVGDSLSIYRMWRNANHDGVGTSLIGLIILCNFKLYKLKHNIY
ncbi:hypothetical protein HanIR_Chr14g0708561 [Helianthus annuus]|nr:hypothetical protein HanIR_Chr14g0708561 [Helianthus annuus]